MLLGLPSSDQELVNMSSSLGSMINADLRAKCYSATQSNGRHQLTPNRKWKFPCFRGLSGFIFQSFWQHPSSIDYPQEASRRRQLQTHLEQLLPLVQVKPPLGRSRLDVCCPRPSYSKRKRTNRWGMKYVAVLFASLLMV